MGQFPYGFEIRRLTLEELKDLSSAGKLCCQRPCPHVPVYFTNYKTRQGTVELNHFGELCEKHARLFTNRHGLDFPE
jgi:hypothetical protein